MAQDKADDLKNLSPNARKAVEALQSYVLEGADSQESLVIKAAQLMTDLNEPEKKEFEGYFRVLSLLVNAARSRDGLQDKGGGPQVG